MGSLDVRRGGLVDSWPNAAFYAQADYAGFWRRLAATGIDLIVIFVLWRVFLSISNVAIPDGLQFLTLLLVSFGYGVVFKWSRISTLGYRICHMRIVNHLGGRPGLLQLTFRLLSTLVFWMTIIGPVDLLWMFSDPHRQTLHDKSAGTYVVKTNAQPIGRGKVIYVILHLQMLSFILPEIRADV